MNRWLQRHPLLLAACLSLRTRWMRAPRWPLALAGAAAGLTLWLVAPQLWEPATRLIEVMVDYSLVLAGLSMLHALLVVSKLRKTLYAGYLKSWLAAAPIARRNASLSIAVQIAAIALVHLILLLLLVGLVAWLGTKPGAMADITIFATTGFASGAALALLLRNRERQGREATRYAPRLRTSADRWTPSSRPLAHWPMAQVFAWHRPENLRVILLAVLFTVQGGSSMLAGLCVVSAWLLAIYLVTLLHATIHVGQVAAHWLRCTPMPFLTFAWPIARQSFSQQVIGAAASGVLGVLLGSPVLLTCYLVALWIMVVALVLAVSLADSYRNQRSTAKLALSLTGVAAIEMRAQGWSIPVALLLIGWHVRRALQTEGRTT
ncbi:MAG TPA: hypothetical protein VIT67_06540 [Povalibacter sp.]